MIEINYLLLKHLSLLKNQENLYGVCDKNDIRYCANELPKPKKKYTSTDTQ